MSLEDVFISIVDQTTTPEVQKGGKKPRRHSYAANSAEKDIAQAILDSTAEQQKKIAPYQGED